MRLRSLFPPWVTLMLVSPAIGEVLSGSSPPRELLNPVALLFLIGLYGSGALLAREIAFRWRKGGRLSSRWAPPMASSRKA